MGQTTSPLRYPGGKSRLSGFIKQIIQDNDLLNGAYVEVYAGGAGAAWPLLFEGCVSQVILNDIDYSIYAFWQCVFNQTEKLCQLIQDTPVTIEEWKRQKAIQTDPNHSILDTGFSTFFLNRTNRSGIILGGIVGGKEQDGIYKLDARYKKEKLVAKIQKIAGYKDRVKIFNQDALFFIRSIFTSLPEKTLIYLDPPYYQKGSALYEHHYTHDDHVAVANMVRGLQRKWMVSYDAALEISDLYTGYEHILYNLSYSAGDRYKGHEIIFFSPGLVVNNRDPLNRPKKKKTKKASRQLQFV